MSRLPLPFCLSVWLIMHLDYGVADTFVEQRTQAKFNKFLKAGTVLKNYAHVLVLLLRLRQLACHPSLITDGYDALQVRQLGQKEYERALLVLGVGPVAKIKAARLDLAVARVRAERDVSFVHFLSRFSLHRD